MLLQNPYRNAGCARQMQKTVIFAAIPSMYRKWRKRKKRLPTSIVRYHRIGQTPHSTPNQINMLCAESWRSSVCVFFNYFWSPIVLSFPRTPIANFLMFFYYFLSFCFFHLFQKMIPLLSIEIVFGKSWTIRKNAKMKICPTTSKWSHVHSVTILMVAIIHQGLPFYWDKLLH